jgi:hypothetical protein
VRKKDLGDGLPHIRKNNFDTPSREKNLHERKKFLILSTKTAVFCCSLTVMALLAQWLPVVPVPEQLLISLVWCDVVYNCGFLVSSLLQTANTKRM